MERKYASELYNALAVYAAIARTTSNLDLNESAFAK
jgi:hypothetical protein